MAGRKRPEGWPGVPHEEEAPTGVYSRLDDEGARWIGAAFAWLLDVRTDARRKKSAGLAVPAIWQHRERGERTRDGRPFVAETVKRLSQSAGTGREATMGALRLLSGEGGACSPLARLTVGHRGAPSCYRLNAPSEFLGSLINNEPEQARWAETDRVGENLELPDPIIESGKSPEIPDPIPDGGKRNKSGNSRNESGKSGDLPDPHNTHKEEHHTQPSLTPNSHTHELMDPEPTLTCNNDGGDEASTGQAGDSVQGEREGEDDWIPDKFGWGGLDDD